MINRHGLMRLGALQRITELQTEIDELRTITRAPAQGVARAQLEHRQRTERRATSADRSTRETPRLHWTQRPENKARVRRMARRAARTRKQNGN